VRGSRAASPACKQGSLNTFRQTGSVLGVALFGSLLAGVGATAGLHTACALAVELMLVVAVLLCMAGEQPAT
jgi:DHA2 family methylenomycin A resistance protein-like MFS transporter